MSSRSLIYPPAFEDQLNRQQSIRIAGAHNGLSRHMDEGRVDQYAADHHRDDCERDQAPISHRISH